MRILTLQPAHCRTVLAQLRSTTNANSQFRLQCSGSTVKWPSSWFQTNTARTVMDSWISNLAAHGFVILFAAVFLEAIGFPVPAALALLFAGGASARGVLPAPYALSGAIAAMLVGDTLMFLVGR